MMTRLPVDPENLAAVPEGQGAYILYARQSPIYAGVAAGGTTLRAELAAHLRGEYGEQTREATHCAWQETASSLAAYGLQLAVHARWDLRL
jgi:hypothetical protein